MAVVGCCFDVTNSVASFQQCVYMEASGHCGSWRYSF